MRDFRQEVVTDVWPPEVHIFVRDTRRLLTMGTVGLVTICAATVAALVLYGFIAAICTCFVVYKLAQSLIGSGRRKYLAYVLTSAPFKQADEPREKKQMLQAVAKDYCERFYHVR